MSVYLIHLEPAYKHARHYLGYADDVHSRLALHRMGQGSRLCQVAVEAGCKLILARVWEDGDRSLERRLKNRKAAPRLCPICNHKHDGQLDLFTDFDLDDIEEVAF
ncbi:MAG TPA: hypothetical protein VNK95_14695 [Caldilineaceae bacterium]|nr:hypothetical protein [Caldilineaceae bacterium]